MIKEYIKLLRIPHWIKNLFVFVPVIFSKHFFDLDYIVLVVLAFFSFSVVSSIVYVFNDLVDIESDKNHPSKRQRPIASGTISKGKAKILIAALFIVLLAFIPFLNLEFLFMLIYYLILNILYSIYLKHIVILDLISISVGFLLRVIGGAFIINVYISSWLILTTLFISLFLAVMKRRSELVLTENQSNSRKVLEEYSLYFIDQISAISAACVIISYALYSVAERTVNFFGSEYLVYTTIFVVFGIFRYMYLVFKKSKGENPTEIMLTDIPMISNLFFYFVSVIIIIYIKTQ